jgi:hypothetical protein
VRTGLPKIRHDLHGFKDLVLLYEKLRGCVFEEIEIDLGDTEWFDADMCAPFGAILYRLGALMNSVRLVNIPLDVERILSKNGFLSSYGRRKIPDTWGTTIPYRRFEVKDDRYFGEYIEAEFVTRSEMPRMSRRLVKKFRESVFEIFSNAVIHSRTEHGIFSCGQYFPKRNRLDFSVVDLGTGIRRNIKELRGLDLPAEEAIKWATSGRNTTKRGPVPGGLGLKLLLEFIKLNGGRIQIISDGGYWNADRFETSTSRLGAPFPGTIVALEINTSDTCSYALKTGPSQSDIF